MQGFNKYYPPEYDGKKTANQLAGKNHPLGNRASKIKQGILTVRFEAPFDISCSKCERNIAQGVRFNAAKKKVGNYYTTPIWSFLVKCPSCSNPIDIRTDPQATSYTVETGGKRRFEPTEQLEQHKSKPSSGPDLFADVEHDRATKTIEQANNEEIQRIFHSNERQWKDPFSQSQKLRETFRQESKVIKSKEDKKEEIVQRTGFQLPLLEQTEEDATAASEIVYGNDPEEGAADALKKRLHSKAFENRAVSSVDRAYKQKALSKIAVLVDEKDDAFASTLKKRKQQTNFIKHRSKPSLQGPMENTSLSMIADYSSDESE